MNLAKMHVNVRTQGPGSKEHVAVERSIYHPPSTFDITIEILCPTDMHVSHSRVN